MSSYRAYLLRLWADKDAPQQWRFSLEDPHTHQRRGFASLEELVCFLQADTLAGSLLISDPINAKEGES